MKSWRYRYRNQVVAATAVIAAFAAAGTYFAVSGNAADPTASKAIGGGTGTGTGTQFITESKASAPPSARPSASRTKAKPSASPKSKAKPGALPTSPNPSASASTVSGASAAARSPYTWPFSWDSIWNIPIASTATYAAADITSVGTYEDTAEADLDSVSPSFPVVTLEDALLTSGSIGPVSVYGDPAMTGDGAWNSCAAFLGTDGSTVYQGQTTELTAGGNPSFGGLADVVSEPVDIEGTGTTGCHGGSGLSGLGGTLTLADLTQSGPITHALKIALDGYTNYSSANGGFRWPAVNADTGFNEAGNDAYYGGSNPNVQEGSLLALPTSISPSSFSDPVVAKIAQAMQDYGAYIVDNAGQDANNYSTIITNYNSWSYLDSDLCGGATTCDSQLNTLIQDLEVVTNNTASTPGGGAIGVSRCAPYAPEFTDGSDAPPSVTVVTC